MYKNHVENVPVYFEPFVNDCFSNAASSILLYHNLNPALILADFLCFMFDTQDGYIGMNYLVRPLVIRPKTEECLTSFEFVDFPPIVEFDNQHQLNPDKGRISFYRLIESNPTKAYNRVKELIDNGIPAIVSVDLYYIRYHRAYQKEHGIHNIVITGYDEKAGHYEVFDKYLLSGSNFEGILPMDEVKQARKSKNPSGNILTAPEMERPIRHESVEMFVGNEFEITKKRMRNILKESCLRMLGKKRILNKACGIPAFDEFVKSLLEKQREGFSDKNNFYFREYLRDALKQVSRSRLRFSVFLEQSALLEEHTLERLIQSLQDITRDWDIAANLSYKMTVTKKMENMDLICKRLENIKTKESAFIDRLSGVL